MFIKFLIELIKNKENFLFFLRELQYDFNLLLCKSRDGFDVEYFKE